MTTLYTDGSFTRLSPSEFASYDAIRYSAAEPTRAVSLGFTTSGTVDFSARLGSVAADIEGWGGADVITSGSGADTLWGDVGNDTLYAKAGDDVLIGDWNDGTASGDDLLFGGDGNDFLAGGPGRDLLYGDAGDDLFFVGSSSRDSFFGGDGFDVVSVTDIFRLGTTSFAFKRLVLDAAASIDLFSQDDPAFRLTGTRGDDLIDLSGVWVQTWNGHSYANSIEFDLKTGHDTYIGSGAVDVVHVAGSSAISLGAGDDVLFVAGAAIDGRHFNGNAGTDRLQLDGAPGSSAVQFSSLSLTAANSIESLWDGGVALQGTGKANLFDLTGISEMNVGTISLLGGNDRFVGSDCVNVVDGGSGADTLLGGMASDRLFGGGGADSMVGGDSNDLYEVDSALDRVVEGAGQGTDTVQTTLTSYRLGDNVENLAAIGSTGFTGTGNALNNRITGDAGNDTLRGLDGDDALNGGAGADKLIGGTGSDVYTIDNVGDRIIENAGVGRDDVFVYLSRYTLGAEIETLSFAGSGKFHGTGNALDNSIWASNAGNATLNGQEGKDTLWGCDGNDVLIGGAGADLIWGGLGDDIYVGVDSLDTLLEGSGEGTDVLVSSMTTQTLYINFEELRADQTLGAVRYTGNAASNTISGASGSDLLRGMEGDDTLIGGAGIDTLVGGDGDDEFRIDDSATVIRELSDGGTDVVYSSATRTVIADNVEKMVLTSANGATGIGSDGYDTLIGGRGDDSLIGMKSADELDGGKGADTMKGGEGGDWYWVDNPGDLIIETANSFMEIDRVFVRGPAFTIAAGIELVTVLSTAGTMITGNAEGNLVFGGSGGDTLLGMAGDDTLVAGSGHDRLEGGTGNDLYQNVWRDLVIEAVNGGYDTIETGSDTYTLPDNVEDLAYAGGGAFTGIGNAGDNHLFWRNPSVIMILEGMGGNDTLTSGSNADTLIGGDGDDTYYLNSDYYGPKAVVIETATADYDTVISRGTYTLTANVEKLVLETGENINGTGNELDNVIEGGGNTNTVCGGLGNDTLSGGGARDHFKFTDFASVDHVTDFSAADGESILLDQAAFAGLAQRGAGVQLRDVEFKDLSLAAEDASDRILYDPVTGALSYDADGRGGTASVLFAIFDNKPTLTAADFWLA